MQAGWVSLGTGETAFVLSPSGEKACEGEDLPPTIALSDRYVTIVVEKVTGQVARNNEVDFRSRSSLRNLWEAGVPLRKGEVSNIVDPALISPLLQHQPTEWIRWIGPITVLSDNAAFAVMDVDVKTERIIGLPKSWAALLLPECLEEVRRRERELADRGTSIPEDLDRELRQFVRGDLSDSCPDEISDIDVSWSPVTIGSGDILRSFDTHRKALSLLVNEAVNYVAIACPYLANAAVAELIPVLTNGLARGLLINVFLGKIPAKDDKESRAGFDALKKLEYDSSHGTYSGRLTVGTRATECWASMALVDTADGASAIVGSHSWTASRPSDYPPDISVRLRDAWAVARLCEVLDGFSSADERLRLEAGFVRLKKAAASLRQLKQSATQPTSDTKNNQGSILLDREIWLQQGPIGHAVRASIGMPRLFSPTRHDDRWLIDGGLVNPVPVSLARALGADIIIAVDLNVELVGRRFGESDIDLAASTTAPAVPAQAPKWLKDAVGPILQRVLQAGPDYPSYFEVLANSLNIMQDRITRTRLAGDPPDVLLCPRLGEFSWLDFHRANEAIAEGSACVRAAEPIIRRACQDAIDGL